MVVCSEERVEHEELPQQIDEIQAFGYQVQRQQIVTVPVAALQMESTAEEPAQPVAAASLVLPLIVQVVIQMPDHVLDRLVPPLRVEGVLDRLGGFDEIVDVNSRPFAEDPPHEAGYVEHERLHEKQQWYPLVVPDVLLEGSRLPWLHALR